MNLALLPKSENASKNNKKLIAVDADWLKDCIERYEFIPRDKFLEFSDISNYKKMFEFRKPLFEKAFTELTVKDFDNAMKILDGMPEKGAENNG